MRALALLALALVLPAFAATMYKWKDEKGVTHFSEDPPPDGKAQMIDVRPVPPSSNAAPAAPAELKQREIDLRQKRQDKQRTDQKAEQDAARRDAQCRAAQRDLDVLRRERPVYSVNSKGERVYIEDKDRATQIASAQRLVETYCRN